LIGGTSGPGVAVVWKRGKRSRKKENIREAREKRGKREENNRASITIYLAKKT
jgi:hypothetical protein